MPVVGNDYFGTLGADVQGLEYILDQGNGRLQSGVVGNQATGAGSAALGANCPATTATAPNTWVKFTLADGSLGYFPVWK